MAGASFYSASLRSQSLPKLFKNMLFVSNNDDYNATTAEIEIQGCVFHKTLKKEGRARIPNSSFDTFSELSDFSTLDIEWP